MILPVIPSTVFTFSFYASYAFSTLCEHLMFSSIHNCQGNTVETCICGLLRIVSVLKSISVILFMISVKSNVPSSCVSCVLGLFQK